jgi:ATP-binding cassette subfamily B protein
MTPLDVALWPAAELAGAVVALARAAGLPTLRVETRAARGDLLVDDPGGIERTAIWLGLEAEAVDAPLPRLDELLRGAGPAILRIERAGKTRVAALLDANPRRAVFVSPHGLERVAMSELRAALVGLVASLDGDAAVDAMLDRVGVAPARRARARGALLHERSCMRRVGGCWILRRPASAPFLEQLRASGLLRRCAYLAGLHATAYALVLAAWWTIGRGALSGHLDRGFLAAFAMLLATTVPVRVLELRAQASLAIDAALLLKRRLMQGALAIEPEEMRGEGAGQLLGRAMEANAMESLAISGGIPGVLAAIDLAAAAVVLGLGAAGVLHVVLLAAWMVVGVGVLWNHARVMLAWTDRRLALTHDLVERMTGHRTRIAQQPSDAWHGGEDEELSSYLAAGRALDRRDVLLTALLPAGWLFVGFLALAPALLASRSSAGDTAVLALSIAGILLAFQALRRLAVGVRSLIAVGVAWRRAAPLFEAGGRVDRAALPEPTPSKAAELGEPILSAHDLLFRYRAGGEPVLRACTLRVDAGDRLLLEGSSGGGKSTLVSVLAGVRGPESGTLLLRGLDRRTLGAEGWRRRVVAVPQFHENHVVSSTFAFNLLMGRGWPPRAEDVRDAETLCRDLGLGEVLDRMPSGLSQIVGETGWQLSHGERSRLYVARALLCTPDVLVLDESFAALDPATMRAALSCVFERAPALLVVAHP